MAVQKTPRTGQEIYTAGSDPHPNRAKFNSETQLIDALVAIAVQGTTAERPSAGIINRLYWDTTFKRLYWDDGDVWSEVTTNGGGGAGGQIAPGAAGVEGTSNRSARADHTHFLPLATVALDGAMSKADKAKLDAATASATPSTLVMLDANSRAQIAIPSSAGDIANKSYVDTQVGGRAPASHTHTFGALTGMAEPGQLPLATATAQGAMSAADKVLLNNAAYASFAETLVRRDPVGRAAFGEPTANDHAATKRYVDQAVAGRAPTTHAHEWGEITGKPATFPPAGHTHVWGDVTGKPSTFTPSGHSHSGSDITSGTIHPDRIANATSALDGLFSKTDKAKLDGASASSAANTLMMTDSNGRYSAAAPSEATHVTNKEYVDSQVDTRAASNHTHTWNSITGKPTSYRPETGYTSIVAKPGDWRPKWTDIDNLPPAYNPTSHSHTWGDISGSANRMAWSGIATVIQSPNGDAAMSFNNSGAIGSVAIYNTNAGSGSSYRAMWVNSSGVIGYNLSSRKYKTNERDYTPDAELLDQVTPKWFQYKTDVVEQGESAPWRVNFIAEDLHDAGLTEYVSYDGNGTSRENAETINEQLIVNALWAFAKQQRDKITQLEARINALEGTA